MIDNGGSELAQNGQRSWIVVNGTQRLVRQAVDGCIMELFSRTMIASAA